jgi:hypothetical protein
MNRFLLVTSACVASQMFAGSAFAQNEIYLSRDTVIPIVFNDRLSVRDNHSGDPFSVTIAEEDHDFPQGTRIGGHVADIHGPRGNHPPYMDLRFDEVLYPDGSHRRIDAVPIPLNSKAVHRDRDGRYHADEKKIDNAKYVFGGLIGGLILGDIFGKPFEGAFAGTLAGVLVAASADSDPDNRSDVVARPGDHSGALLKDIYKISDGSNVPAIDPVMGPRHHHRTWDTKPDARPTRTPAAQKSTDEVKYDEKVLIFPDDAQPYWSGDTLLVPLDFLADKMDLHVSRTDNGLIFVENDDNMLRLEQDSTAYRLNGKHGDLPVKVEVKDGKIFIPIDILATIAARDVYVNGTKLDKTL